MEDRLLTDATLKLIGHDQRAPLMTMREIATQQDTKTAKIVRHDTATEIIQVLKDWCGIPWLEFSLKYPEYTAAGGKGLVGVIDYLTKKYGLEG